jgi:hypothetical protein
LAGPSRTDWQPETTTAAITADQARQTWDFTVRSPLRVTEVQESVVHRMAERKFAAVSRYHQTPMTHMVPFTT